MNSILIVDTCSDLPLEFVEKNSDIIDIIGMPCNIKGQEYIDDFGKTLSHKDFYNYLREGIMPSTSQINSYRFFEIFKKHYNEGKAIIYIGFTSGMSGTINNAFMAKNMLLEEYPDADITVIDTLSASIGEGALVYHAVEMLRNGISNGEIVNWIEDHKLNTNHWFAVNDLNHLKNGGRISAATAAVGTLLNIKPILTVNNKGKLVSYSNIRGRKKSLKFLVDKLKEHVINPEETIALIGHGDCIDDAEKLKEMVQTEFNLKKIVISELSLTIATHVGPGMISLAFVGNPREDK